MDLSGSSAMLRGVKGRSRKRSRSLAKGFSLGTMFDRDSQHAKRRGFTSARAHTISRDAGECVWCGKTEPLHVHHIVPLSHGGGNELDNLVTLCVDCHGDFHGYRIGRRSS